jgi:HlyD family secretion protein
MMNKTIRTFLPAGIILLVVLTTGCGAAGTNANDAIQASGVIEATEVAIASELSGRVVEVSVAAGDTVHAGDILFTLDDTLLQAQAQAAEAALVSAQKGAQTAQAGVDSAQLLYDITLSSALAASQPARLEAWDRSQPASFDLPAWYFDQGEQIDTAQAAIMAARTELRSVRAELANMEAKVGSAQFLEAESRLSAARLAYQLAQALVDQAKAASDGEYLRDAAQAKFDDAKAELDSAQRAYDDALTTEGAKDILKVRARVAVAQEGYELAQDALRSLQVGTYAPDVSLAASSLDQAQAALEQAQALVDQAQAGLDLVALQIEKLTVRAPQDGVVLARSLQPGEILTAGMTALTIGDLDALTVTVYIPENLYGQISLGDAATLTADSFPGESFTALVTRIADQAEFTPQNVQTTEGRQTTVYAIELAVDNTGGKLKPGMPVDVEFTP